MSEPIVRLESIGRRPPRGTAETWLIRDVNLRIDEGDRIAVTGSSGSGKTVLLRQIAALDSPDEGRLLWNGHHVTDSQVPTYRSRVIYLHQRPFFSEGTVLDNLISPFRLHVHRQRSFCMETTREKLSLVERSDTLLARDVQSLSGGESQLVSLLRAMQLEPDILVLDEPTASADQKMTVQLEQLVHAWYHDRRSRALVVVTHDPDQVARMSDRTYTLEAGRIVGGKSNR